MLILTRRVGEVLMIGDDVVVTVLASRGNQVRIGIEAPKDTEVHREEIYYKAHPEKITPEVIDRQAAMTAHRNSSVPSQKKTTIIKKRPHGNVQD